MDCKIMSDTIVEELYRNYLAENNKSADVPAPQHRQRIRRLIDNAAEKRADPPEIEEMFKGGQRICLDILPDEQGRKSAVQQDVERYLKNSNGMNYSVTDYVNGYATDPQGKQSYRIGALLKDNPSLLQAFSDDATRVLGSGKLMIVLSRDPEDLANMSAGRKWGSCTSPDGVHPRAIAQDIRNGALIAYLVRKNDPDIRRPLARSVLKPYFKMDDATRIVSQYKTRLYDFNRVAASIATDLFPDMNARLKNGLLDLHADALSAVMSLLPRDQKPEEVFFVPAKVYGLDSWEFRQLVQDVADRLNHGKNGDFFVAPCVYPDRLPMQVVVRNNRMDFKS